MRYRKIKFNGTEVHIERMVKSAGAHDERTDTLKSFDAPRPEFNDAMQAFVPSIRRLLELPGDYDLRVTGLSISYQAESERRGLVITCQKKLADANAPLVFNTPHLPEEDVDDPNPSWPPQWYDLLEELEDQATAYVDGKREQQDLFEDDADRIAKDPGVKRAVRGLARTVKNGGASLTIETGGRSVTIDEDAADRTLART